MKRLASVLLIAVVVLQASGCTAPTKVVNGVEYRDYGLLNPDDQNPNVQYEPNWWNIAGGVIFFELIIPPIYVFGYHLFEPVGLKPAIPGQVTRPEIRPQR